MKLTITLTVAIFVTACFAATASASQGVRCSTPFPDAESLFGADSVASGRYIVSERFGSFRCWEIDEDCTNTLTWSTVFTGATQAGIAIANGDTSHYWAVDPLAQTIDEYDYGVGTATGAGTPLPPGGLYRGVVIDDNQPGQVTCVADLVTDTYVCIDLSTGAFICSYANADGAYGSSIGDAVAPGDCSGATLVQATGTTADGMVVRVGQYDCTALDPACSDRWDLRPFSTSVGGIDEVEIDGVRCLLMVDRVDSTVYILWSGLGIADCQDIDTDMDLLYSNARQGGMDFNVDVNTTTSLGVSMHRTPLGSGKFVFHMNAGAPTPWTVGPFLDLGNSCFSFIGGSPVVVENNVGKPALLGSSNYFGTPISNPAKAPTYLESLLQPVVDTANLPVGTVWTLQSIHTNAAASSKKGASLSNAFTITMN